MASKDIRKASPREQARWLRDRGWFLEKDNDGEGWWYYGAYMSGVRQQDAIVLELAAEALRRKRAEGKTPMEIALPDKENPDAK